MKKITDLFTDFFDLDATTNLRLDTYAKDQLARLVANNPNDVFDPIIANTQDAIKDFGNAMLGVGGDIGDRKASTQTKDQARENFNAFIRQKEGLVKSVFGKPSPTYTQFFPDGLNAFNTATDQGYEQLVRNIQQRAAEYETELGTPFLTQANALADAYLTAELKQTDEKGDVSASRDELAIFTSKLTRQLTLNALTIALQFPFDESKYAAYFDTSLLFAQKRKHIYKGEPAASATIKVVDLSFEAGKNVHMKNKGAAALRFQMHLQGNAVGESFTVEAGQKLNKQMSDFFSNADSLWVTNVGSLVGKYEVELVA